ncbi:30S ribosomal protein S8 [Candidatus Woesearchaeota archaeon]|nr:30S ribosomal protein S8 [Candidatus Woesearchaeota archaeon]
MLNDPLSNALSKILNAEQVSKSECIIKPVSNTIKKVLKIMQEKKYLGGFDEINDGKGNFIKLNLLGQINKCGAIKPRYPIKWDKFERFENRYLPAKDFGIILVSTNRGIMTHIEAKEKKLGGILVAYCY